MGSIEHAASDLAVKPASQRPNRSAIPLQGYKILSVILIALLSACSGSDGPTPPKEPELKEIPTTETPLSQDASEAELMFRGKRYFEGRVFGEAKKAFQTITSNYPLGPYAEFASVKYADTVFELQDYGAAAGLYEELYKNHPGSEFAPYALFRAARSLQFVHRGVGRDDTALHRATKLYDELLLKHPDSFYARAAKDYRDAAHRDLAQYEEEVAAFYRKRNKSKAAEARQLAFQQKWEPILADAASADSSAKSAPHISEQRAVLERIAADLDSTARKAAASEATISSGVAATPAKGSKAAIVKGSEDSGLSSTPVNAAVLNSSRAQNAAHFVSKLECTQNIGTQLTLFVSSEIPEDAIPDPQRTAAGAEGSPILIKLPDTAAQPSTQRCPNGTEVSLSADGELRITSAAQPTILTLSNPPRVLVLLP